jgi:RNA polymerase sigma-70 factor, ECF subfamily
VLRVFSPSPSVGRGGWGEWVDPSEADLEQYRRQLHVHCYRMLGSVDDAEDLVQETFLRAWRARASFERRATVKTWLYRIATNACLNALERAPRRVLPQAVVAPVTAHTDASEARADPGHAPDIPWLQPYPDSLLDQPEDAALVRESIELAYLAALQHLPPRQRAILILRDVVLFSARETAELLGTSVAAVNSAHQRARATLHTHAPAEPAEPTDSQRAALRAFVEAWEHADASQLIDLLREDARWAMPPAPLWFDGRAAIVRLMELFPIDWQGRAFHMLPTAANRQPAAAAYVRAAGESEYRLTGVHVLRVRHGAIAEIITFGPDLCRHFPVPTSLAEGDDR